MTDTGTKAPWHLWLVGGISILWNGFGAFDFAATSTRFEPWIANFPPAMIDYIYALPAWMWVCWAVGTIGALVGSVLLLMRRKFAIYAFGLSLLGAVASNINAVLNPPPAEVGSNPVLAIVIIVIAVFLLGYSMWLSRRGVLR